MYLKVLDLRWGSSVEDVNRRYRELVREWHPDGHNEDKRTAEIAAERLRQVIEAVRWLRANASDWSFDAEGAQPGTGSVGGPSVPAAGPRPSEGSRPERSATSPSGKRGTAAGPTGVDPGRHSEQGVPAQPSTGRSAGRVLGWVVLGIVVVGALLSLLDSVLESLPLSPGAVGLVPEEAGVRTPADTSAQATPSLGGTDRRGATTGAGVSDAAEAEPSERGQATSILDSHLVLVEDSGNRTVTLVERERSEWKGFTFVELAPIEEDREWFGWAGGDRLLVFNASGERIYEQWAPFAYSIRDVTGDGAAELVVRAFGAGVSGCCDRVSVLVAEGDELRQLYSAGAFGSIALVDLDGDGRAEVVGHDRLGSDVLPQVSRVAVPFACKWDGDRLVDVSTTSGEGFVLDWMADQRGVLIASSGGDSVWSVFHAARGLVAAALLFDLETALDELRWLEEEVGSEAAGYALADFGDFAHNLERRYTCK